MITIIIAAVLLVGGGIAAALILKDSGSSKTGGSKGEGKPETAAAAAEDSVAAPTAEVDPVKHYNIKTIISGYPIEVRLDIDPDGVVTGKYAYQSTLGKYGDVPSSWFTLRGTDMGADLVLDGSNPDYGVFERWEVSLKGEGDMASLSGIATNFNTYEYFYVGSKKKPEKYYDPKETVSGEDYQRILDEAVVEDEPYEPERF